MTFKPIIRPRFISPCRQGCASSHAFTLIELLVVVAIIALLLSILIPSLSRAREQAKMTVCGMNAHSLALAFITYSVDNKGRLPGVDNDAQADWWGRGNPDVTGSYRAPEGGTLYKKYIGRATDIFYCPTQNYQGVFFAGTGIKQLSYKFHLLLSGAPTEWLASAHYPDPGRFYPNTAMPWDRKDHRPNPAVSFKPFEGVPMLVEVWLKGDDTYMQIARGRWFGTDGLTDRHQKGRRRGGAGNIAFHDGHVSWLRLPARDPEEKLGTDKYFSGVSLCVKTRGGRWIAGHYGTSFTSVSTPAYGLLLNAPPDAGGVRHK